MLLHEIGGSRWEKECFGEMAPDLLALNSELEAGLEGFGRSHRASVLLLLLHRIIPCLEEAKMLEIVRVLLVFVLT
jgi:hypothetical protein